MNQSMFRIGSDNARVRSTPGVYSFRFAQSITENKGNTSGARVDPQLTSFTFRAFSLSGGWNGIISRNLKEMISLQQIGYKNANPQQIIDLQNAVKSC